MLIDEESKTGSLSEHIVRLPSPGHLCHSPMIAALLTDMAGRNLRERNQEVEQLKQKVRELEDAARGTPSATANELAPTNTRANAPWDVSRAPTHLEEMHFTGEPMPTNNSVCCEQEISSDLGTDQTKPSYHTKVPFRDNQVLCKVTKTQTWTISPSSLPSKTTCRCSLRPTLTPLM